jgi:vancomycin permeability regulator SanA
MGTVGPLLCDPLASIKAYEFLSSLADVSFLSRAVLRRVTLVVPIITVVIIIKIVIVTVSSKYCCNDLAVYTLSESCPSKQVNVGLAGSKAARKRFLSSHFL